MLPYGFRSAHNSEGHSNLRSANISKLLVTRRSWLLDSAKPVTQVRTQLPFAVKRSSIGVGDFVDSGAPSKYPTSERTQDIVDTYGEIIFSEAELRDFLRLHGFRTYQIFLFIFSVLTYVFDVGSDAYLVYSYYKEGDYYWSGLTLALLLIPALTMTAFSLAWYILDRKVQADPPRSFRVWFLRLLFHGLQLSPLVRMADALYYGIASRRADLTLTMAVHYTQLMLYEDADSAMLRMMECFMEAAPQLLLQLYIIFTQTTPEYNFQFIAQIVSCFTSWLSLAWSLTHYQSALRNSRAEKSNLNWSGSALFFSWKAAMLASRILALSLLAALARGLTFGVAIGMHWAIAVGWLITRGTTFCSPNPRSVTELLFDLILAAVYCFDVVNVREGHSRLWYISCYLVIGLENLLVAILWSLFMFRNELTPRSMWAWWARPLDLSSWIQDVPRWILPSAVVGAFLFGLAMMLLYYMLAHPSGNIKCWVPCDILLRCDEYQLAGTNVPVSDDAEPKNQSTVCVTSTENV